MLFKSLKIKILVPSAYIYTNIGLVCIFIQVGDKGCVVGIEHIKDLNDQAIKNVQVDSPELLKSKQLTLLGRFIRTHISLHCDLSMCCTTSLSGQTQVVKSLGTKVDLAFKQK